MSWQNLINGRSLGPNGVNRSKQDGSLLSGNFESDKASFPAPGSAQRASGSLAVDRSAGRHKVRLEPGHSPLDWAVLKLSGKDLRGIDPSQFPMRVSKEELRNHRSQNDCWTAIKGRVYNITPYLKFHPGGVNELMKCAGTDGTFLFNKYHAWVSAERILDGCLIGFLAP